MRIFEPCAGAAAVSLAAYAMRPPAKYRGGKRRYAPSILRLMGINPEPGGLFAPTTAVSLTDPGLWGRAWELFAEGLAPHAIEVARSWEGDGRDLFMRLQAAPVPSEPVEWLATFLALQGAAVLGKEVFERDGRWVTSGYSDLSDAAIARGFGEELTRLGLVSKIERVGPAFTGALTARQAPAGRSCPGGPPSHVLIDPPYRGTSGYSHALSRDEVIAVALYWRDQGCVVGVCEHEPIEALVKAGFVAENVEARRGFAPRNKSRSNREVLTLWRP